MDPTKLKDTGARRPHCRVVEESRSFSRLRKPGTLYDKKRKFVIVAPERDRRRNAANDARVSPEARATDGLRPETGWDVRAGQEPVLHVSALQASHDGNLLNFHGLPHAGTLCGGTKFPADRGPPGADIVDRPTSSCSSGSMTCTGRRRSPICRCFASSPIHHTSTSSSKAGRRRAGTYAAINIFDQIVPPALKTAFIGRTTRTTISCCCSSREPAYAPTMIDMAHLGTMLGGSFLPGIEVGREAGIATELVPVSRGHAVLSVDSVQAVHEGSGAFARHVDERPRHSVERGFQGMRRVLLADLASGTYDQRWGGASELADHAQQTHSASGPGRA